MAQDIVVKIKLDNGDFVNGIAKVDKQIGGFGSNVGSIMKKVASAVAVGFAVDKVKDFGLQCLSAGADLEEMKNKFDVVFKTTAKSMESWANTYADSIGRASSEIMGASANIADLAIGMGMQEEQAGALSKKYVELAYDLASFNNASDAEAIDAVTAAMFGETEQMKKLGVNISVATMENSEYVKSLGKKWDALTQAEKAEAYYQEMLKQSVNAIGDAERSSESYTNQVKRMEGNILSLKETIGTQLMPVFQPFVEALSGMVSTLDDGIQRFFEAKENGMGFGDALKQALITMGLDDWAVFVNKIQEIGKSFTEFFTYLQENEWILGVVAIAVGTLTTALLAYNASAIASAVSTGLSNLAVNAWVVGATLAETVTMGFAVAMQFLTSPITLVILAIGALIGVVYLLITHWDTVKEVAIKCWEGIKNAWNKAWSWFDTTIIQPLVTGWNNFWSGIGEWASGAWEGIKGIWSGVCQWFQNTIITPVSNMFSSLWEGIASFLQNPLESIKGMFKSAFNWIADKINIVIDGLNKFQVPEGIPIVGGIGINIPRVPKFWKGTNFAPGGLSLVGEQGAELIDLPRGSRVLPAHKTRSVLNGAMNAPQVDAQKEVNVFIEVDGRTLARAVGQPLMDTIRLKTGLAL